MADEKGNQETCHRDDETQSINWNARMRYTVHLKQCGRQYDAVVPLLPACTARGQTREEVFVNLKTAIEETLSNMEITTVEVNLPDPRDETNPWLATAGMFQNDPLFDDMLAEVKADRQRRDGQHE